VASTPEGQAIDRLEIATMRVITRQLTVVLGIGSGSGKPRRTAAAGAIDPLNSPR
jgi:hypothetical protein